ncbi:MAG: GAF domain-containing protein [Burkholderiaceae bacterium]
MPHNFPLQELCGQMDRGEIDREEFVQRCTQHVAREIGCSRAGIWIFVETAEGRVLRCLGMYDAIRGRSAQVSDESGPQVSAYFDALARHGHVLAVDARSHPATAGFFEQKLLASDVHSLMAASFGINGKLFGAYTCTQVGEPMTWSLRQLAALKEIGARSSLALSGATTAQLLQTMPAHL